MIMLAVSGSQFGIELTGSAAENIGSLFFNPWLDSLIILGAVFFFGWLVLLLLRKILMRTSKAPATFQQAVLLILVPRVTSEKEERELTPELIKDQLGGAENFFSVLGGLRAQRGFKHWLFGRTDHFAFEIIRDDDEIKFYAAVPKYFEESFKQQLLSAYPYAQIEEVKDYNIFTPQGRIVSTYLKLGREFIFPIKTYKNLDGDPLESITNTLSKLSPGTEAAVQLIARSSHKRWHRKGHRVAREVQQGKPLTTALRRAGLGGLFDHFFGVFIFLFSFFKHKKPEEQQNLQKSETQYKLSPMEQNVIKGLEEKTSKAGFDVNLRIIVSANQKTEAQKYLDGIVSAFAQYNIYQYGNGFKKARSGRQSRLISDFIQRWFAEKYKMILNAEEMSSLWHLPLPSTRTPNLRWLEARKAQPPVNLPKEGLLLGVNEYRGTSTPVRIKRADRQRHVYIIGKSGTGKSVLQANMIIQDIKNGEGVCVVDPHGDLVEAVLEHVPAGRAEDVIFFDPADNQRPLGLNMLEFNDPEQKTFVINEMINIFDKLYDLKATGGPMFEQYMRNAMLLMMEDGESGSTLLEVPKVLADASFRRYKLSKCLNPVVKDFWEKEAGKAGGEASLENMVPYITSKLTPFVSSDLMRPIIAQQHSSFNFREAMDTRKIILVKLSKGKIGELSANLLGMVIVGKILLAALSRVDTPDEQRQDFYLYIDEFQNFTTESIGIILSEARKYKLCLTIAHQFIGQLVKQNDTRIKDAVFGNAGTIITFRIGPDDAEIIAKQLAPVFNQYDVINVPKFNAYVKLLIDNQNPPAFNLAPLPPESGDKALAASVKELSRLKYGRDRAMVEQEILQRIRLAAGRPPVAPPTL